MMKILFISRLYPNEYDHRNGAVMHRQALELIDKGFEVQVISPIPIVPKAISGRREKWMEYHKLPKERIYEGVKVWHPRFFDLPLKSFDIYRNKSIIKAGKKIIDDVLNEFKFDIIHSHMAFPDSSLGTYLKEKYNKPLITTIRSTDMDISIKNNRVKQIMLENLTSSNVIISPSPQLSNKLNKEFNLSSTHIGNGIYPIEVNKQDKELIQGISNNEGTLIVSISNLFPMKGIRYNILAINELIKDYKDIKYIIIGDGPEKKDLEGLVDELNLRNHIVFKGNIDHKIAMEYLKVSDIFSMPSYRETLGLVYLEAMYFKKPIILCENNGVDGIVKNKESAMIVPAKDFKSITKAIQLLISDEMLYSKVASNGYEIVKKNYLWEQIGQKLINIYKDVIKNESIQ